MNINLYKPNLMKSLFFMSAAVAAGLFFTACDDLSENERFQEVERPEIARRVLVQEFTGQGCINCPAGAAIVHSLQEQNPGSIIAVNLHPENTQYTRPIGGLRLTSPLATVYFQSYSPSALPAAVIDGSSAITNTSLWTDAILSALGMESAADLELTSEYDEATRQLTVTYKAEFNKVFATPLSINIWITEDGIVGPQYSGSSIVRDYVHNHVLRTSLTGDWGEKIGDKFIPDEVYTDSFTITLSDAWNAENCNIVGFLQTPSRSVEQSAEISLVNEE